MRKATRVTPQEEDKKENITIPIRDGSNDEVVLAVEYNADQMARCLEEMFELYSLAEPETQTDEYGVWPDLRVPESLLYQAPTKEASTGNLNHPQDKTDSKTRGKDSNGKEEGKSLNLDNISNRAVFCDAASAYISERLESSLFVAIERAYVKFSDGVMKHALKALAESAEGRGMKKPEPEELKAALSQWDQMKRARLGLLPQHRPQGREGFQNCDDFLTALKAILSNPERKPKPPNRRELWHKLRNHKLYIEKENKKDKKKERFPSSDEARTLKGWLNDCGIESIKEAIQLYWKGSLNGE